MIVATNLCKNFGEKKAVSGLNLNITEGSFYCFLGPNGAGKTTTIKMLTGLLRPSNGKVFIHGLDIQEQSEKAKGIIGYIPDHPFLYEKLTGREFLHFVSGIYCMTESDFKTKSRDLIGLFELEKIIDQLIEDYSHGMRQKLSFAACFLHEPKIMIIDEPWVGLDPKNIRFIKKLLKDKTIKKELTVFMSTHTLSIVEEIADVIGIINNGKLIHQGTVAAIKAISSSGSTFEDVFISLTN